MKMGRIDLSKLNLKQKIFILIFIIGAIYILFIKSELYESSASIVIKDLNSPVNVENFPFIMPTNNNQDVFVIKDYLSSFEELQKLNKKFNLKAHYKRFKLDVFDMLKPWSTKEDFLKMYQKRLVYIYDQTSGIVKIGFLHTNPATSYEIVKELIKDANEQLNKYNKIIAKKQLEYLQKEVQLNKEELDKSVKALEEFQNKYMMLNPVESAKAKFALVSNLQAKLIEKKAELHDLLQYMNESSFEVRRVKAEIRNLQSTLKKIKKALAGPHKRGLNVFIFEYERLKNIVDLNKELYKESLLQLEKLKADISKNSKLLLEITKPYIPQSYKYPEKLKDIITLLLILALIYGVISLIEAIVKEHFD